MESSRIAPEPVQPARAKTILERSERRSVTIGDIVYQINEVRPVDIPCLMDFIALLASNDSVKNLKNILNKKDSTEKIEIDLETLLGLGNTHPLAVCQLLAAILDPDPLSSESGQWRTQKAAEFMTRPISEITKALGVWLEVNASFFARQVTPLVLGIASVVNQMDILIMNKLTQLTNERGSSIVGNA
jgi:hypothetical protein